MAYNIKRQAGNAMATVVKHSPTISASERELLAQATREVDSILLGQDHPCAMVCTRAGINVIDLALGRTVAVFSIEDAEPEYRDISDDTVELHIIRDNDRFNLGKNWER